MKKCPYCGRENCDEMTHCHECGTPFERASEPQPAGAPQPPNTEHPDYEFAPLSPADRQKDLVTLVTCGTLVAADMVVARLQAAGIMAFIPDECLMQSMAFGLGAFGYVRIQVAPTDYDAAKDLLADS
jgi:hypothetical protein